MNRSLLLLLMACGLLSVPSSASAGRLKQTVFATVGWSEWCPPGFVMVDLEIGRFEWIAQLRQPECAQANSRLIVKGQLPPNQLGTLQAAAAKARETGLIRSECKESKPLPEIAVSNAIGPYILVLSGSRNSMSAPNDIGCWNSAATNLRNILGRFFDLRTRPIPKVKR